MAVYGKNCATGKWYPKNPEKYVGNPNEIVYRSSWELKTFNWLDNNDSVIRWNSEEVIIPYYDSVQNKPRRYFVDIWAEIKHKTTGKITKYLFEIKPKKFTIPPVQPKKKSKKYIEEVVQFINNQDKWNAARKVCSDNGMQFMILTEDEIYGKAKTR